eukprot:2064400-Pyramimonas_sp.AAC.2
MDKSFTTKWWFSPGYGSGSTKQCVKTRSGKYLPPRARYLSPTVGGSPTDRQTVHHYSRMYSQYNIEYSKTAKEFWQSSAVFGRTVPIDGSTK